MAKNYQEKIEKNGEDLEKSGKRFSGTARIRTWTFNSVIFESQALNQLSYLGLMEM